MKLLKIICAAKVQEEADNTSQAQNHNLQAHSGVTLVRLPLCGAWLAIKEWLRELAGVGWDRWRCARHGAALKQDSGFRPSSNRSLDSNPQHQALSESAALQPGGVGVCDCLK